MIVQQKSVTVVLCVHNAAETLATQVDQLLDVLMDLSSQFEILVLDNGSDDATDEIAHMLSREYPQVRVIRHRNREPNEVSIDTGFREASGELVLIYKENSPVHQDELVRVWQDRVNHAERPSEVHDQLELMDRLTEWAARITQQDVDQDPQPGSGNLIHKRKSNLSRLDTVKPHRIQPV